MKSRRSFTILIILLVFASLLLVACERPLQTTNTDNTAEDAYPADTGNAAAGDAVAGDTGDAAAGDAVAGDAGDAAAGDAAAGDAAAGDTGDAAAGDAAAGDAVAGDTGDAAAGDAAAGDAGDAAAGDAAAGDAGDAAAGDAGDAAAGDAGDDTAAEEGAPAGDEATADEEAATGLEGIAHTVAEDETIFDIAAQYGASWVIVAEYNKISDVSTLQVGGIIYIPDEEAAAAIRDELAAQLAEAGVGEEAATEEAVAEEAASDEEAAAETDAEEATGTGGVAEETADAGTATETIYVVRPGDNLYRIGVMFGISWVQIAEANGIVNPNDIKAGQELKIPVSAPGPAPEFTHVVQRGDTLFKISLRYGVSWQAIAHANNLRPPYFIYPGQTLIIPGNG